MSQDQSATALGRFSVSLAVKDIHKSLAFYQALGFEQVFGEIEQNWVILQHGEAKIGLFQGMFEANIMTFNPKNARAIEAHLKAQGIAPDPAIDAAEGPCHFMVTDPDGNTVLVDQHEA